MLSSVPSSLEMQEGEAHAAVVGKSFLTTKAADTSLYR
jgi:hypothetical protein